MSMTMAMTMPMTMTMTMAMTMMTMTMTMMVMPCMVMVTASAVKKKKLGGPGMQIHPEQLKQTNDNNVPAFESNVQRLAWQLPKPPISRFIRFHAANGWLHLPVLALVIHHPGHDGTNTHLLFGAPLPLRLPEVTTMVEQLRCYQ